MIEKLLINKAVIIEDKKNIVCLILINLKIKINKGNRKLNLFVSKCTWISFVNFY